MNAGQSAENKGCNLFSKHIKSPLKHFLNEKKLAAFSISSSYLS